MPVYMIVIYCVVIAAFCGGLAGAFIFKSKRDKKHYERLHGQSVQKKVEEHVDELSTEEKLPEVPVVDAELEDFQIEVESKPQKKDPLSINPFDFDDFDEEDDFDDRFEEYEKFLKENINFGDEEEESFEDEAVVDEVAKFDFRKVQGKSDDEIREMLKDFSPKARDVIMADILAQRKFEDEE